MAIERGNDVKLSSEALTDENDAPVTAGTVNFAIVALNKREVFIANSAATHGSGGVWSVVVPAAAIATIPSHADKVLTRMLVGTPATPNATRYREESVI